MGWLALAWPFVKTWWKVIVPVVLLLAALGYVKILHVKIDHYKSQVIELKQEKAVVAEKNNLLEHAAADLSKKYERRLDNMQLEQDKRLKTTVERIKKDEESKRIILTGNLISLFNAGKPDTGPAPQTKLFDAGTTDAVKEAVKSFNDLLVVSNENDSNHLKCINQVHEWQDFWKDYSRAVEGITR